MTYDLSKVNPDLRCGSKDCRSRQLTATCELEFVGTYKEGKLMFESLPSLDNYKVKKFECKKCGQKIKPRLLNSEDNGVETPVE